MTSPPDAASDSPAQPSPTQAFSASSRDWGVAIARTLFHFSLVLAPIAFIRPTRVLFEADYVKGIGVDGLMRQVYIYLGIAIFLAIASGVLMGLRLRKLSPPISPQLPKEQRTGSLLWGVLQTKINIFVLQLSAIEVALIIVSTCMACFLSNTQFIFAVLFLVVAIMYLNGSSRLLRSKG